MASQISIAVLKMAKLTSKMMILLRSHEASLDKFNRPYFHVQAIYMGSQIRLQIKDLERSG
jgi:hypothetical protein